MKTFAVITPIDVIDSAVKIGLGALITGLATYWLTKASYGKTLEKERWQRKRDALDAIAQQVSAFDDVVGKYLRSIRIWLGKKTLEPLSEAERSDFSKLYASVYEASNQLTSAKTRLILLGETSSEQLLKQYWDSLLIYRVDAVAAREITTADVWSYRDELVQKRDRFLTEIGRVYRSIP